MAGADGVRLSRRERARLNEVKLRLETVEKMIFQSFSTPGKFYTARVLVDGKLVCNCRGWTVRREGRPRYCTHLIDLVGGRWTRVEGQYLHLTEKQEPGPDPLRVLNAGAWPKPYKEAPNE